MSAARRAALVDRPLRKAAGEARRRCARAEKRAGSCLRAEGRSRRRAQVSISAFAFIFSELVQYHHNRVQSIGDLERRCARSGRGPLQGAAVVVRCAESAPALSCRVRRLEDSGHDIGCKLLELTAWRERPGRRETTVVSILQARRRCVLY